MKKIVYILLLSLFVIGCSTTKEVCKEETKKECCSKDK